MLPVIGAVYVLTNATRTLSKVGSVKASASIASRAQDYSRVYGIQFHLHAKVLTNFPIEVERAVQDGLGQFRHNHKRSREVFCVNPDWARDLIEQEACAIQAKRGTFFIALRGDGFVTLREGVVP